MANLTQDLKEKRDRKVEEVDAFIAARQQIRERLIANCAADVAKLDAEIAEHTLIRNGLAGLK